MREIKFRAWDKRTRTMKYPKPYDNGIRVCPEELKGKFCPSELVDKNGHNSHISDVLMSDVYIPMQYIGRKDKNGKEIYEGDIFKDGKGQTGKVFYSEKGASFLINWKMEDGSYQTDDCFSDKVVGNIYENRELLGE